MKSSFCPHILKAFFKRFCWSFESLREPSSSVSLFPFAYSPESDRLSAPLSTAPAPAGDPEREIPELSFRYIWKTSHRGRLQTSFLRKEWQQRSEFSLARRCQEEVDSLTAQTSGTVCWMVESYSVYLVFLKGPSVAEHSH